MFLNHSAKLLLTLGLLCLFTKNTVAMPACPTVPDGGCSVCGAGSCVGEPGAIVALPTGTITTCGELQDAGFGGFIQLDQCAFLPPLISTTCGCSETTDPQPPQPPQPVCDFGPDALTNAFLAVLGRVKSIPRTCINVPVDDGSTTERCYYTYVPDSCAFEEKQVPLVIDNHGRGSCPLSSTGYTGWWNKAEEECFVVVYPSGNTDQDFLDNCWQVPGLETDSDFGTVDGNNVITSPCCCQDKDDGSAIITKEPNDPLFLKMVIDDVVETLQTKSELTSLAIDTSRVYMAGHSNGCVASLAMGALYSDTIAAVCCHAGLLATPYPPEYTPIPTWLVHGRKDTLIPYDGSSTVTPSGEFGTWSIDQTQAFLAEKNVCKDQTFSVLDGLGSVYKGSDCEGNANVEVVTLDESGHLPYLGIGIPFFVPEFGGSPTTIDTTALAWDFCSSYSKPTPNPTSSPTEKPTKKKKKGKKKVKRSKSSKKGSDSSSSSSD